VRKRESSILPWPSFDHRSPFEFEAQFGEKGDSGIKRFHHDADVVHPLKRHATILADRNDRPCPQVHVGSDVRTSGWANVAKLAPDLDKPHPGFPTDDFLRLAPGQFTSGTTDVGWASMRKCPSGQP
jgi:hypothetical protein